MSRVTHFFSGKFQNLGNCAGVKHLTNIMSVYTHLSFYQLQCNGLNTRRCPWLEATIWLRSVNRSTWSTDTNNSHVKSTC